MSNGSTTVMAVTSTSGILSAYSSASFEWSEPSIGTRTWSPIPTTTPSVVLSDGAGLHDEQEEDVRPDGRQGRREHPQYHDAAGGHGVEQAFGREFVEFLLADGRDLDRLVRLTLARFAGCERADRR